MNLITYTDSVFNFDLAFKIHIHEFLDFSISSKSYNKVFYRYIPGFAENLDSGMKRESLVADLFKSFNFFSRKDREESGFKLQSIDVSLLHKLHDWDLSLTYSGKPVINEAMLRYEWSTSFTILVQWNPVRK